MSNVQTGWTTTHLDGIKLLLGAIPLVCEPHYRRRAAPNCDLVADAILRGKAADAVACRRACTAAAGVAVPVRLATATACGSLRTLSGKLGTVGEQVLEGEFVAATVVGDD